MKITRLTPVATWLSVLVVFGAANLRAQGLYIPTAPKPPRLAAAKTVFLSNNTLAPLADSDKMFDAIYASIQQLNRFNIVQSPSEADLILEYGTVPTDGGGELLFLRVIDPKTGAVLWSTSKAGRPQDFFDKGSKAGPVQQIAGYLKIITTPSPVPKP